MEINRPRLYANVNATAPVSYYDYEKSEIRFGDIDDYQLIQKLGQGKYSEVFLGLSSVKGTKVAIKVLKAIRKKKVQREVKILLNLRGHPNVIELVDVVQDPLSKCISLVLEHAEGQPVYQNYDVRYYMYELMKTLDYCHSRGVMHRDIKPQNIVVDRKGKKFKLLDFGLAEFYHLGNNDSVRVASRYYKGPELLVRNEFYDYSLDVWSAGAVFAGLLFKKEPFFQGADNWDQLFRIALVLGSDNLWKYIRKYGLDLPVEMNALLEQCPKKARLWTKFITLQSQHFCSQDGLNLLSRMLVYDHVERILPREALEHEYFAPFRNK